MIRRNNETCTTMSTAAPVASQGIKDTARKALAQLHGISFAAAAPVIAIAMTIVILAVLTIYCICRCKKKLGGGYSKVRHNLEDEEREFQRKLEESIPTYDELFKFEDDDDMELDEKELERLTLLEDFADGLLHNDPDNPKSKEAKESSPTTTRVGDAAVSEGSATQSTPQNTDGDSNRPRGEGNESADDTTEASPKSISDGNEASDQDNAADEGEGGASADDVSPVKGDADVAANADADENSEDEQF